MTNLNIPLTEYYETVPLSDLIPLVALNYEGADSGLLAYYIREAYIEFCRDTEILVRSMIFQAQDGLFDYLLSPPDYHAIKLIDSVRDKHFAYSVSPTGRRIPSKCFQYKGGVILFGSQPCGEITVEASCIPTRESCLIDKDIYDTYGSAIRHGVDRIIMGSNVKKWRNPSGAANAYSQYRIEVENAKEDIKKGQVTRKIYYDTTLNAVALGRISIGSH